LQHCSNFNIQASLQNWHHAINNLANKQHNSPQLTQSY